MPQPGLCPEDDEPPRYNYKLNADQRAEILRRIAAGESQISLAREFKVSHTAIYLVKVQAARAGQPDRDRTFKKRLLPEEVDQLKAAIKETVPADYGAIMAGPEKPDVWTLERARALARKLFGKTPSVRALTEFMPRTPRRVDDFGLAPPKPPGPPNLDLLPPELAADKGFVKYYLSPIARQIEQREYEAALAHYHERLAREAKLKAGAPAPESETDYESDDNLPPPSASGGAGTRPASAGQPAPGTRVGKHGKNKGNPFTKPKRRKNKH